MTDPKWLEWARRIQAIARAGLTYTEGVFDRERYERLQTIAAEIMAGYTGADMQTVRGLLDKDLGYPTPKVDVRGAVFRDGKILLVQEALDNNRWTLPGGWADIYDTPSEAVIREICEESGFHTRAVKLLAVYDKNKQGHPPGPNYTYKLFFRCEIVSGKPRSSIETNGIAFFAADEIPELSPGRVLPHQIARMFEHYHHPDWPTDFD